MTLIEVDTDEGITGIGAADAGIEAAVAIDRFVAPHLIGRDPMEIERLTGVLKDAEIMAPPVYCVELCLWDIVGKVAGLPVYKLWGGHKDRIPAYCATGELRSPERRAEDVRALVAEGFRGVKLRFHRPDPRDDIAVVEAVRAAVGGEVELIVDANQAGVLPGIGGHDRWNFQVALSVARELERLGVLWLEEPLPRHDYAGLARLRDRLDSLALAGGECNHGIHEFKLLIDRGCYDILQPDVVISEGAFQLWKVSALAEAAHLRVYRTPGRTGSASLRICTSPRRSRRATGLSFRTTRAAAGPPLPATKCSSTHRGSTPTVASGPRPARVRLRARP
jgi:L-alanine-DL-glutamate epimerase and related enzymes of enolase superfamily